MDEEWSHRVKANASLDTDNLEPETHQDSGEHCRGSGDNPIVLLI